MALARLVPASDVAVVDGQVQLTKTLGEYVRTKLTQRFRFFLGEWFRDERKGIPYYRDVLGKNPNINAVRSVFRAVLQSMPEVADVAQFDLSFTKSTRRLAFDFVAVLTDGSALIVRPTDDDFVLDL